MKHQPRHKRGLAQPKGWTSQKDRSAGTTKIGGIDRQLHHHLQQRLPQTLAWAAGHAGHARCAGSTKLGGTASTAGTADSSIRYLGPWPADNEQSHFWSLFCKSYDIEHSWWCKERSICFLSLISFFWCAGAGIPREPAHAPDVGCCRPGEQLASPQLMAELMTGPLRQFLDQKHAHRIVRLTYLSSKALKTRETHKVSSAPASRFLLSSRTGKRRKPEEVKIPKRHVAIWQAFERLPHPEKRLGETLWGQEIN